MESVLNNDSPQVRLNELFREPTYTQRCKWKIDKVEVSNNRDQLVIVNLREISLVRKGKVKKVVPIYYYNGFNRFRKCIYCRRSPLPVALYALDISTFQLSSTQLPYGLKDIVGIDADTIFGLHKEQPVKWNVNIWKRETTLTDTSVNLKYIGDPTIFFGVQMCSQGIRPFLINIEDSSRQVIPGDGILRCYAVIALDHNRICMCTESEDEQSDTLLQLFDRRMGRFTCSLLNIDRLDGMLVSICRLSDHQLLLTTSRPEFIILDTCKGVVARHSMTTTEDCCVQVTRLMSDGRLVVVICGKSPESKEYLNSIYVGTI